MLSSRMWQLIAVSALLGIGSGMIVPLSTGLISRHFIGRYRTRQFGLSSAITNITLVTATVLTGYLAEINWHLPFIVYFFPVVSFFLSFYLKRDTISVAPVKVTVSGKIEVKRLVSLMLFYGLVTYLAVIVSFNLPFLMKEYYFFVLFSYYGSRFHIESSVIDFWVVYKMCESIVYGRRYGSDIVVGQ